MKKTKAGFPQISQATNSAIKQHLFNWLVDSVENCGSNISESKLKSELLKIVSCKLENEVKISLKSEVTNWEEEQINLFIGSEYSLPVSNNISQSLLNQYSSPVDLVVGSSGYLPGLGPGWQLFVTGIELKVIKRFNKFENIANVDPTVFFLTGEKSGELFSKNKDKETCFFSDGETGELQFDGSNQNKEGQVLKDITKAQDILRWQTQQDTGSFVIPEEWKKYKHLLNGPLSPHFFLAGVIIVKRSPPNNGCSDEWSKYYNKLTEVMIKERLSDLTRVSVEMINAKLVHDSSNHQKTFAYLITNCA